MYIYVKYGPRIPGAPVNRMQGVRSVTLTGDASRAESSRHRAADDRLRDLCNYIMNHRIAEIAITSIIEVRRISRPTWRPHWHTPRRGGQPVGSSVGHDGPGLKERLERAAASEEAHGLDCLTSRMAPQNHPDDSLRSWFCGGPRGRRFSCHRGLPRQG